MRGSKTAPRQTFGLPIFPPNSPRHLTDNRFKTSFPTTGKLECSTFTNSVTNPTTITNRTSSKLKTHLRTPCSFALPSPASFLLQNSPPPQNTLSALTTNPTKHEPPKLPPHNGKPKEEFPPPRFLFLRFYRFATIKLGCSTLPNSATNPADNNL